MYRPLARCASGMLQCFHSTSEWSHSRLSLLVSRPLFHAVLSPRRPLPPPARPVALASSRAQTRYDARKEVKAWQDDIKFNARKKGCVQVCSLLIVCTCHVCTCMFSESLFAAAANARAQVCMQIQVCMNVRTQLCVNVRTQACIDRQVCMQIRPPDVLTEWFESLP